MSRALALRRHLALGGGTAGLLAAGSVHAPSGWLPCLLAGSAALAFAGRTLLRLPGPPPAGAAVGWLAALVALAALAGLGAGEARLAAIDRGALAGPLGEGVVAVGHVSGVPRRSFGEVRVPIDTADGRVLAVAPEPVAELAPGEEVRARGVLERPADEFLRSEAERAGARLVLRAGEIVPTGGRRGGLAGALDSVRRRAEGALGTGMDGEDSALARGFVLGQDDLIEPDVREQFKRSGLSHLLAVSGQNVMLLAILGGVIFGLLGAGPRLRLVLVLLLIAAYVPIAGGGPSILRAGVMGAAAIGATLAGRPADRAYALLLAAVATLLINPRFDADPGWQLSFAALTGIMLWAAPLRSLLAERLARRLPARLAGPLAEGAALTVAATAATAPLIAHAFERLSVASLPANLAVLPAVAPVMWLGMLIGLLAQLPSISVAGLDPIELLGAVEGRLVSFVAAVADLFSRPDWAEVPLPLPRPAALVAAYAGIAATMAAALAAARRRANVSPPPRLVLAATLAIPLALLPALREPAGARPPPAALRITALDVGQGDAILLETPRGSPVLIDAGPPGTAAAEALRRLGVERLRAAFVTHDQLDHAGGMPAVLERIGSRVLVRGRRAPESEAAARGAGARVLRAAEGSGFRFGRLDLEVLWPPRERLIAPPSDPNADALVLLARFRGWSALLPADAEQEATRLDPGPLDVLKIAHHGSDDAGLEALLDRSAPRLALISVGSDNGYGHPTEEVLATLASHAVCVLRTDLDGTATVELGPGGAIAAGEDGAELADRPGCAAATG